MERGRKPEPVGTKLARGTFQPCRDGQKVQIVAPGDPPLSRRFQELLIDEHRGNDFTVVPDRAAAIAWLQRG